jgi:hypothetical protein
MWYFLGEKATETIAEFCASRAVCGATWDEFLHKTQVALQFSSKNAPRHAWTQQSTIRHQTSRVLRFVCFVCFECNVRHPKRPPMWGLLTLHSNWWLGYAYWPAFWRGPELPPVCRPLSLHELWWRAPVSWRQGVSGLSVLFVLFVLSVLFVLFVFCLFSALFRVVSYYINNAVRAGVVVVVA